MTSSNRRAPAARIWGSAGASAALVLLVAASAAAIPAFPERLEKDLGMPCTPSCTVCHMTTMGGFGTLRNTTNGKPGFGKNLHTPEYGLVFDDPTSLERALQAAETPPELDSDGDGTPDVAELKKCEDPNNPTLGATLNAGPEFGCVRVARQGPVDGVGSVAAAAVLALGLAALRRRRRAG